MSRSPRLEATDNQQAMRKIIILLFLALVIGGSSIGVLFSKKNMGDGDKQPKAKIKGIPTKDAKPEGPAKLPDPPSKEAFNAIVDNSILDDKKEKLHDDSRIYVKKLTQAQQIELAKPVTAEALKKDPASHRGKMYIIRGKLTSQVTKMFETPRASGAQLVYRGTIVDAGGNKYAYETLANVHGARPKEYVFLRGMFYKLAALQDEKGGVTGESAPFFICTEIHPDYARYIKRIPDGGELRDPFFWYLVRKVQYDLPKTATAEAIPTPTAAQIDDLGFREKIRGRYITIEGKLTDLKHKDLDALKNRAFINDIWEGTVQSDDGRLWRFDSVDKPAYDAFLRHHRVKLVGAFAKRFTWTDDSGKKQGAPYLVTRNLDLAGDVIPYTEIEGLLDKVTDNTQTRDVTYYQILHHISSMTQPQISEKCDKAFTLHKIVTDADRKKMRGELVQIKGRLLKVEPFELSANKRINPSGVTTMYRAFVATSTQAIYTVELIEEPDPKVLRPGRTEVVVQGAFWQVWTYDTRVKGESEKSPWLIARTMSRKPPPSTAGLNTLTIGAIVLIGIVVLFLIIVGGREIRNAGAYRRELLKKRVEERKAAAPPAAAATEPAPAADAAPAEAAAATAHETSDASTDPPQEPPA